MPANGRRLPGAQTETTLVDGARIECFLKLLRQGAGQLRVEDACVL